MAEVRDIRKSSSFLKKKLRWQEGNRRRCGYISFQYQGKQVCLVEIDRALETLRQNGTRIDLVLTDMSMPVMNGAELARRVKQLSLDTPVVICTGFSDIAWMRKKPS